MNRVASCVLEANTLLGECPVWSVREQVLYFADILGRTIHRFDPARGRHDLLSVHEEIGCFGLRERGGFIAAMRSGIFLLDAQGQVERKLADNPSDPACSRFNDGRVDPWGRFWCGTVWEPRDRDGGVLCRIGADRPMAVMADGLLVANGLAFSPDRRWMYQADTPHHVLYRYPLDVDGEPGPRQVLCRFERPQAGQLYGGRPDGAAVDCEGCYWSAQFDGCRVLRLSPDGEVLAWIDVPVRRPTMVAFGGEDLRTLYITSTREGLSPQELVQYPQSGHLFAVRVEVAGQAEPSFKEITQ